MTSRRDVLTGATYSKAVCRDWVLIAGIIPQGFYQVATPSLQQLVAKFMGNVVLI